MTATRSLSLQRARFRASTLEFVGAHGGLARALADGCFFLEIPSSLDVSPGVRLSREFYRDEDGSAEGAAYRNFRALEGLYFDREHFQTEHVLIDGPGRAKHFAPELVAMCDAMNALGLDIFKHVLAELGVPENLWTTASGGAIDNRGTHWFASSHYRPNRDQMGCAPHKDTGFVTVLYYDQAGLEAFIDGAWVDIDPMPRCFLVNFGAALEIFTDTSRTPVKAILHRVRRIAQREGTEDRFSFAAFVNPPAAGWLYQWQNDDTLTRYKPIDEFLAEFNKQTWNDRHDHFGIK